MQMSWLLRFVDHVANYFNSKLQSSLVEVYKIGSLAHGGFSQIYSDIDVGDWLGYQASLDNLEGCWDLI